MKVSIKQTVYFSKGNTWNQHKEFRDRILEWLNENFPEIEYSYYLDNSFNNFHGGFEYTHSFIFNNKDYHASSALKLIWT